MVPTREAFENAVQILESWAAEPQTGLPESLFQLVTKITPIINVDLVIGDSENRTLLTWRSDSIYGDGWHIPGGVIRFQETMSDRIHATAREELGAPVEFDPKPIAIEQSITPERRLRGHFISVAFRCRLLGDPDEALRFTGLTPERGQWAWHERCPANLISAQDFYRPLFP